MKIVIASTSAVKIEACGKAFGDEATLIPVKVPSHVNEQPIEEETLRGAFNRLSGAFLLHPDADFYVAIESGLFLKNLDYVDRAVVIIKDRHGENYTTYSDGVVFPKNAVEETRARGFAEWTVGKIMEERGIVAKHDDPHLSLSGKSRVDYINETVLRAVKKLSL